MKFIRIFLLFSFCFLLLDKVNAQKYKSAPGLRFSSVDVMVGYSVSYKYFFSKSFAGEALLSFYPGAVGLLLEYHQPLLGKRFQLFYGAGGFASLKQDTDAGVMAVIGIDYKLPIIPFNLSLDYKPEVVLTNDTRFKFAVIGFSARYTFKEKKKRKLRF